MAKKKEKKLFFPEDYPGYKILKKFNKPRSPRTRLFTTHDEEGWFIDVMEMMTKSKQIVSDDGWIIEKDVPHWTLWYENLGWTETTDKS